jgi:MtrB/PioB family decaheme-associated outer membrane protein
MKTTNTRDFSRTLIALAVLSALGQTAHAQEAAPQSSVSIGGLYVSGDEADRARFSIYNGLREHSGYGLFDFSWVNRDAASGLWMSVDGRNLFLDTRELNGTWRRLGDWKVVADYSEIIKYSPYTINTGMTGAGTTAPQINRLSAPGTGQDLNLDTKRKGFSLGASKWFGGEVQVEAWAKSEEKEGARLFGRGFACSGTWVAAGSCASSTSQWALFLTPEPIDSTINQFEAKLTWAKGGLLLTGGYYGNYYKNRNSTLNNSVPGTINNPLGAPTTIDAGLRTTMGLPLSLWPDSESNQLYVLGNYRFSPSTVANFKYAYTKAKQNEDFASAGYVGVAPAGQSNLGGEVDTQLFQAGISSRPMKGLTLLANYRYESKDNKTPIAYYNVEGTDRFTNGAPDPKKEHLKLEASYLLPEGFRGTVGYDYDQADHGTFTPTDNVAGITGLRQKTKEDSWRVELRRSVSEDLTGFVTYTHSDRKGDSPWLKPLGLPATGVIEGNTDPACTAPPAPAANPCLTSRTGIYPFIFEDRKREKVKGMLNWVASDTVSVQFLAEYGKDTYDAPNSDKGLQKAGVSLYSVDASWQLSETMSLTAYASTGDQTTNVAHSTGYIMHVKDNNTAAGLTFKAKASERMRWNADFTYLRDRVEYPQELDAQASAANIAFLAQTGGVPDVTYKLMRIKLTGDYDLDKKSMIRGVIGYEQTKFNDWTWQWNGYSFLYSDNTTVGAKQDQSVTFFGLSYTYRW